MVQIDADLFKRRVKNHLYKIDAWASIRIYTVHNYTVHVNVLVFIVITFCLSKVCLPGH